MSVLPRCCRKNRCFAPQFPRSSIASLRGIQNTFEASLHCPGHPRLERRPLHAVLRPVVALHMMSGSRQSRRTTLLPDWKSDSSIMVSACARGGISMCAYCCRNFRLCAATSFCTVDPPCSAPRKSMRVSYALLTVSAADLGKRKKADSSVLYILHLCGCRDFPRHSFAAQQCHVQCFVLKRRSEEVCLIT